MKLYHEIEYGNFFVIEKWYFKQMILTSVQINLVNIFMALLHFVIFLISAY